jgi:hypothetical protein
MQGALRHGATDVLKLIIRGPEKGITVTVLDCTPQVRHDNLSDSAELVRK